MEFEVFRSKKYRVVVLVIDAEVWIDAQNLSHLFLTKFSDKELRKIISQNILQNYKLNNWYDKKTNEKKQVYPIGIITLLAKTIDCSILAQFQTWVNSLYKKYHSQIHLKKKVYYLEEILNEFLAIEYASIDKEEQDLLNTIREYDCLFNQFESTTSTLQQGYHELLYYYMMQNCYLMDHKKISQIDNKVELIQLTFKNHELYDTYLVQACNLLYFLVKDVALLSENKKMATLLFLYYLKYHHITLDSFVNEKLLTSIIQVVAKSCTKDKEVVLEVMLALLNKRMD